MEIKYLFEIAKVENDILRTIIHAAFTDGLPMQREVNKLLKNKKESIIVVAAMPRSGSTYFVNTLSQLTHLPYFRLSSAFGTNEQDLYLPALCINTQGCVAQMHMKGTYHNVKLLKMFHIRPIILVRNIFDTIISLTNDLRKKQQHIHSKTGEIGYSFLWNDTSIEKLDENEFLDFVIDFATPWYVTFYVSWYNLNPNAMWVTYEELMKDPLTTFINVFTFLNEKPKVPFFPEILSKKYNTFYNGKIDKEISIQHRIKIAKYLQYYPYIDFKKYGFVK